MTEILNLKSLQSAGFSVSIPYPIGFFKAVMKEATASIAPEEDKEETLEVNESLS